MFPTRWRYDKNNDELGTNDLENNYMFVFKISYIHGIKFKKTRTSNFLKRRNVNVQCIVSNLIFYSSFFLHHAII